VKNIEKLGHRGEIVKVAPGMRATPAAEEACGASQRVKQEDRGAGAGRLPAPEAKGQE
jgi:hypothetical protein